MPKKVLKMKIIKYAKLLIKYNSLELEKERLENIIKDELTICPNCGEVVLKDDIPSNAYNCDEVCVYCINESGYYE